MKVFFSSIYHDLLFHRWFTLKGRSFTIFIEKSKVWIEMTSMWKWNCQFERREFYGGQKWTQSILINCFLLLVCCFWCRIHRFWWWSVAIVVVLDLFLAKRVRWRNDNFNQIALFLVCLNEWSFHAKLYAQIVTFHRGSSHITSTATLNNLSRTRHSDEFMSLNTKQPEHKTPHELDVFHNKIDEFYTIRRSSARIQITVK